jgi:hypothetical protein
MLFAISSLVNSRFAGSHVRVFPRWYAMKAAWQVTCEFAAAAALALGD